MGGALPAWVGMGTSALPRPNERRATQNAQRTALELPAPSATDSTHRATHKPSLYERTEAFRAASNGGLSCSHRSKPSSQRGRVNAKVTSGSGASRSSALRLARDASPIHGRSCRRRLLAPGDGGESEAPGEVRLVWAIGSCARGVCLLWVRPPPHRPTAPPPHRRTPIGWQVQQDEFECCGTHRRMLPRYVFFKSLIGRNQRSPLA